MRNPGRKALYCLLALAAGTALIRFGALRHEPSGGDWMAVAAIATGFTLAPFGFVYLIVALFALRGRALLLAGHRVIARWHVYPGEWEQFRKLDGRRFAEDHHSLGNDLWIRRSTPRDGVAVVVGETSCLVDNSYHVLRPGGLPELREVRWLEGPPTCLEFSLRYPRGRYGGSVHTTLRIPVPAGARADAGRVHAHFDRLLRRRQAIALRSPRRVYWICGVLLAAAIVGAPAGYALASANMDGLDPLVPLTLMIGGIICAVFAAILILATFLLTRRP
jgi:hypothetical protein